MEYYYTISLFGNAESCVAEDYLPLFTNVPLFS